MKHREAATAAAEATNFGEAAHGINPVLISTPSKHTSILEVVNESVEPF